MTYRFSGLLEGRGHHPTPCGMPTWTCWPPTAASTCMIPAGPSTPRSPIKPPPRHRPQRQISHSLVTGGCQVDGSVENSVLFHSVTVEEGADVQYSILMPGRGGEEGGPLWPTPLWRRTPSSGEEATIGAPPSEDPDWGIAVVGGGVAIGDKAVVKPSAMIREDVKGGEQA